ncbi:MAG TPA: FMN-binding protein [Spirochaetia bacterium]|nr:FMN-binding protein [Spirochaetia bacterium]
MKIKPPLSRSLKALHVIFASGTTGGFLSILVLTAVKAKLDPSSYAVLDSGILRLFTWTITYSSFALIVTSCLYSLFFGWGILKHGWVALKWIIILALFILAWFVIGPSVNGLASISDAGFQASSMADRYVSLSGSLAVGSAAGLILMVVAILLSTIRPFGQWRERESRVEKIITAAVLGIVVLGVAMLLLSEWSLTSYRTMPIRDLSAAGLPDGRYPGGATIGSYTYRVQVAVAAGRITEISRIDRHKSVYVDYAEGVFGKIIRDQNPNTDAVTGATTTSKAYMKAVENALITAGAL